MRKLVAIPILAGALFLGLLWWRKAGEPPPEPVSASPTPPIGEARASIWRPPDRSHLVCFVECPEEEAETVLVVELVIRDVPCRRTRALPLRREAAYDEQGFPRGPFLSVVHRECGDNFSPNARCPYWGGGVSVSDTEEPGVTIDLSYYWHIRDRGAGGIGQQLTIPLGATVTRDLSEDVSLQAYFRAPRRRPATTTP